MATRHHVIMTEENEPRAIDLWPGRILGERWVKHASQRGRGCSHAHLRGAFRIPPAANGAACSLHERIWLVQANVCNLLFWLSFFSKSDASRMQIASDLPAADADALRFATTS